MLKTFFVFLFISLQAFAAVDTNAYNTQPTEIYGPKDGPILVRMGNGGAGPTGLLKILAEDYLHVTHKKGRIAWYQNITRLTLQALHENIIDVSLTYEPDLEEKAVKEGWASHHALIFNDHFLLIGPKENPANVTRQETPAQAFTKILAYAKTSSQPVFLSRDDLSGSNQKEQFIWRSIEQAPWETENPWYMKYHVFPADALLKADAHKLYHITDRGTLLFNKKDVKNSVVYVQGGDLLRNPCHVLLSAKPSAEAVEFYNYLTSRRAQKIIKFFGIKKWGAPLFTNAAQSDF